MARPLLLFDTFIPTRDPEARDTSVTFIATVGERSEQIIPVLLCDIGWAERSAEVGAAALGPLLAERPVSARLAHSTRDPSATSALVRALLSGSDDLTLDLVTPDGQAPVDLPDCARIRFYRPSELEPISVEHYGALEREVLANGVSWQDEPTPICRRPQRVSIAEHTPDELLGTLERHIAACEAAFSDRVQERALELSIEGILAFQDPIALSRLLDAVASMGVRLCRVHYSAAGSATGLLNAVREIIRQTLRGASVELEIETSDDPMLEAARVILGKSVGDPDRLLELHRAWAELSPESAVVRHADDVLRRTVFRSVATSSDSPDTSERATELLGPARAWLDAYRRFANRGTARVVVIPTWQCELRCTYCSIPKQDGRVMTERTLERAIELLLSSEAAEVELHFFGGEPFLEWPLIRHGCEWGSKRAKEAGSKLTFLFTTNAFSLTREMVDWLSDYDARFQLSIDGDSATQNAFRRTLTPGLDSYRNSPAASVDWFRERKMAHDVIQVVHPGNAERMDQNFVHLLELGYQKIQVSFALGTSWPRVALELFAQGLHRIGLELERRWQSGEEIELVNLRESVKRPRTSVEVTVDYDGQVFGSNAFLYIPARRAEFSIGHLDDLRGFDRYATDCQSGDDLVRHWYKDGMAENNQQVGAVVTSFVRWMRARHPDRFRNAGS